MAKFAPKIFLRYFAIVLATLTLIGLGPTLYIGSKAHHHISSTYIEQSTDRAANEFRIVASSTANAVRIVRQWAQSGLLSLDDPESMNHLLFPVMREDNQHFGISIADTDGRSYYITNADGPITTSYTQSQNSQRQTLKKRWEGDRVVHEETKPSDYDARNRPWFYPSLSNSQVHWTNAYIFYERKIVGVTASSSIQFPGREDYQLVIAFDLSLHELYTGIQAMQPSPNSKVMILRRDNSLYSTDPKDGSNFTALNESSNELAKKAHSAWRQSVEEQKIIPVQYNGEIWWCGFRPLSDEHNTWVGIMVPEADTIQGVRERRSILIVLGLASVIIAAISSVLLTNRRLRNQGGPSVPFEPTKAIESIHKMIARGESKRREFKSTMRTNLHTNKQGKEIETAWLKGVAAFLNTDGGTLLLGVSDDGDILGLEADRFENEDHVQLHFKNLIAAKIGAEFSKYIEFHTVSISSKIVGIAECRRASEPVFLKHTRGESFLIRNGPSSDELPISQALEYIKNRK